jgi:dienelactone hydrolase
VLERTTAAVKARGLEGAHVRRIALIGWSAGYGAALKILDHAPHADKIDAVILLDGLHIGYRDGTHTVDPMPMMPIERFAKRAANGEKLFVVTHSNIDPISYLGVKATTDVLLKDLGIERETISGNTSLPILTAMQGVLPRDEMKALEKRSEAKKGGLVIRGYAGDQPAHHIAHLMQMSQIALPFLAERWAAK